MEALDLVSTEQNGHDLLLNDKTIMESLDEEQDQISEHKSNDMNSNNCDGMNNNHNYSIINNENVSNNLSSEKHQEIVNESLESNVVDIAHNNEKNNDDDDGNIDGHNLSLFSLKDSIQDRSNEKWISQECQIENDDMTQQCNKCDISRVDLEKDDENTKNKNGNDLDFEQDSNINTNKQIIDENSNGDHDNFEKINGINGHETNDDVMIIEEGNNENEDVVNSDIINDDNEISSNLIENSHQNNSIPENSESIEILNEKQNDKVNQVQDVEQKSNNKDDNIDDNDNDQESLIEIENENEDENQMEIDADNLNNSVIGKEMITLQMKQERQDNNKTNDKEEMDIDEQEEEQQEEEEFHEPIVKRKTRKRQRLVPSDTTNKKKNVQKPDQESTENNDTSNAALYKLGIGDDYNEEEDEDFNADEEDEEQDEDDEEENEEDIIIDSGEEDKANLSDELSDIDIVHDDKIYTEEAPRWLISIDEYDEFDVEEAYQNWELDKQKYGTIYSDGDNDDNGNSEEINGEGFFDSLLRKYNSRPSQDPEKDQMKKSKMDEYKLDDDFIDDGDCFQQNGVETVHPGFFIARGHIDVKKPFSSAQSSASKSKPRRRRVIQRELPDVPQTYQQKIQQISDAVRAHQDIMRYVANDMFMDGINNNPEKYRKFDTEENKENYNNKERVQHEAKIVDTYSSLLSLLLEFDTELLRQEDMSSKMRHAIYRELAQIFEWDADQSARKQQGNFETLLDWFTHDWFDDDNDERRGNKMNWRLLYLKNIKKRSKARFNSKLNNVRKKEGNKSSDKESSDKQTKKDSMQKKYKPSDVPWDTIVPEIFILTVLSMDEASINDNDMDKAAHDCHLTLLKSLNNYLEGGPGSIKMQELEKKYNEYSKNPQLSSGIRYSWLTTRRIKEAFRNKQKQRKRGKKRKKTPKKSPNHQSSQPAIDLTHNDNSNNSNNQQQVPNKKPRTRSPSPNSKRKKNKASSIDNNQLILQHQNNTNNFIDLTANNDTSATANTSTTISSMFNTPSSSQQPYNSRKRRHDEISNDNDELTQSQTSHQPLKRRRMTNNNNSNSNQMQLGLNNYTQNVSTIQHNSIVCIMNGNSIEHGATLCILSQADHQTFDAIEQETGQRRRNIDRNLCFVPQQYQDGGNRTVLALVKKQGNEKDFHGKYMLAQVLNNDPQGNKIQIKYQRDNKEEIIDKYTCISSGNVPTVIQIPIVMQQSFNNNNHNRNISAGHPFQRKNNNGFRRNRLEYPPTSTRYHRNLPPDPWNDCHFQGPSSH